MTDCAALLVFITEVRGYNIISLGDDNKNVWSYLDLRSSFLHH